MSYSTDIPHYNDPYGYFVLGVASCAGYTRATGLCLNILGIPYEHVNENQWGHQWCRVNINGTYWICDAFGLYCGPEPAPYQHPYLQVGRLSDSLAAFFVFLSYRHCFTGDGLRGRRSGKEILQITDFRYAGQELTTLR